MNKIAHHSCKYFSSKSTLIWSGLEVEIDFVNIPKTFKNPLTQKIMRSNCRPCKLGLCKFYTDVLQLMMIKKLFQSVSLVTLSGKLVCNFLYAGYTSGSMVCMV